MKKFKAAIIGSGNLAFHFLPALKKTSSLSLICLHSRNEPKGLALCKHHKIAYAKSFASLPEDIKLVFIMTNDSGIKTVSQKLSNHLAKDVIIVHFSGSEPLESIDAYFNSTASAWPIQSISEKDETLDISAIPFCISSSDPKSGSLLVNIFSEFSHHVFQSSQEEKSILHLSAVVANNFTNHLFSKSKEILNNRGLDFSLLHPIILKTAENAIKYDPKLIQTGPAKRNELQILKKHNEILQDNETMQKLYQVLSDSIKKSVK